MISIHALREEGDLIMIRSPPRYSDFNPRPPRGGRQPFPSIRFASRGISIHALREEGDDFHESQIFVIEISIHALREEGDQESRRQSRPE